MGTSISPSSYESCWVALPSRRDLRVMWLKKVAKKVGAVWTATLTLLSELLRRTKLWRKEQRSRQATRTAKKRTSTQNRDATSALAALSRSIVASVCLGRRSSLPHDRDGTSICLTVDCFIRLVQSTGGEARESSSSSSLESSKRPISVCKG